MRAARQPLRLAVKSQFNRIDDDGLEERSVAFTITVLAPGS